MHYGHDIVSTRCTLQRLIDGNGIRRKNYHTIVAKTSIKSPYMAHIGTPAVAA